MSNYKQSLSLWKLTNEHQSLLSQLYDYETGEVNLEVQAQLDALEPSIEDKCIAVSKWINKLRSDKQELERLEQEVKARKSAYDNQINYYKNYLQRGMEENKINEIVCPHFTLRLRKNPLSTEIIDESLIPKEFFNYKETIKIEKKPDKNKIKEYVVNHHKQVSGAYVTQKNKLEILIDKI